MKISFKLIVVYTIVLITLVKMAIIIIEKYASGKKDTSASKGSNKEKNEGKKGDDAKGNEGKNGGKKGDDAKGNEGKKEDDVIKGKKGGDSKKGGEGTDSKGTDSKGTDAKGTDSKGTDAILNKDEKEDVEGKKEGKKKVDKIKEKDESPISETDKLSDSKKKYLPNTAGKTVLLKSSHHKKHLMIPTN